MSSRLTFPKLPSLAKTVCNMSFGTESLTVAVKYVMINLATSQSNVKSPGIRTAFFPACEMELSVFPRFSLFSSPNPVLGLEILGSAFSTFWLTLSHCSTFLCCLILRHCRIQSRCKIILQQSASL